MPFSNIRLSPLQRNLIIIAVAGLVIRYVLGIVFTYPRDVASWIVNSENFFMGEGLYGLPGHYYTPVWGYIMAILTAIAGFTGMPISQYVPDFSGSTAALPWYTTLPTMEYALLIKTFLFIVDLLVAWTLFQIVRHVGGSDRMATVVFGVWFLFPLAFEMSAMRLMFENVEILFMLLSLLMMLKGRSELAGVMMGISLLTKPYGIFLGILLIGYAYAQTGSIRYVTKYIVWTAITGLILMAPAIVSGHLDEAFLWLTVRAGHGGEGYSITLYLMPLLLMLSAAFALLIAYHRHTGFRLLMCLTTILLGATLVPVGNVQYYLLLVPLALLIMSRTSGVMLLFLVILSVYAGLSFFLWSVQLYAAEGLWGWETLVDFGEWLYPIESNFNYDLSKTLSGYAAVIVPAALLLYPEAKRRLSYEAQ